MNQKPSSFAKAGSHCEDNKRGDQEAEVHEYIVDDQGSTDAHPQLQLVEEEPQRDGADAARGKKMTSVRLAALPIVSVSEVVFPSRDNQFSIPNTEHNRRLANYAKHSTNGYAGACIVDHEMSYKDCGTLLKFTKITEDGVFFVPLSGFNVFGRGVKTFRDDQTQALGMLNVADVFVFPKEDVHNVLLKQEMQNMIHLVNVMLETKRLDDDCGLHAMNGEVQHTDVNNFAWLMGDRLLQDNEGRYLFLKLDLPARFRAIKLLMEHLQGDTPLLSGDQSTPMARL